MSRNLHVITLFNALISSVPVQFVSESKEILPHCNALISSVPVLSVSESKEIFPHCNAPIISVPVQCTKLKFIFLMLFENRGWTGTDITHA